MFFYLFEALKCPFSKLTAFVIYSYIIIVFCYFLLVSKTFVPRHIVIDVFEVVFHIMHMCLSSLYYVHANATLMLLKAEKWVTMIDA